MKTHRQEFNYDALPAPVYAAVKQGLIIDPKKDLLSTKIFFVDGSYPEYTKTVTYEKYTAEGEAQIVAEGSKNIPLLNDHVEDVTVKVVTIKQGLVITDIERKAFEAGQSQFRSQRVTEVIYRINALQDRIAFIGDAAAKIPTLFNYAGAKEYVWTGPIATMSGFDILENLRALKQKSREDNLIWDGNVLLVAPSQYQYFLKGMSADNPRTVMSYLKEEGLFDLVEQVTYLENVKSLPSGTVTVPPMVLLDASRENMELIVPMMTQEWSTHLDTADNTQINFGARTAGLAVYHEQAITYAKMS